MKYLDEYRAADSVRKIADRLQESVRRSWTLMEVCGGQTHSIMKFGLHELLPKQIRLIHGPGCPVCVTPIELIDHALAIAAQKDTMVCTFGDMVRVPGSKTNLLTMKAKGADVRFILSPLEAILLARANPEKQVVLFGIGFETTVPAHAMAVFQAKNWRLSNFSFLSAQVLVPPALRCLLQAPGNEVQGFLAAGHVCTVTGYKEYYGLAKEYHTPIVVTGFEPVDILLGVLECIQLLDRGECQVVNRYQRSVREVGNESARAMIDEVFLPVDRMWRGIGCIPMSGLDLRENYADYDAKVRFPFDISLHESENRCISGLVLQGKKKPFECPFFGKGCTPENPLGASMVSSEGACAAYYHFSGGKNS